MNQVFNIKFSLKADADKFEYFEYLNYQSEAAAIAFMSRLDKDLSALRRQPAMWAHFYITGAPYRAKLFRIGRRTQFWIVYLVDDDSSELFILRLWGTSRNPDDFEI